MCNGGKRKTRGLEQLKEPSWITLDQSNRFHCFQLRKQYLNPFRTVVGVRFQNLLHAYCQLDVSGTRKFPFGNSALEISSEDETKIPHTSPIDAASPLAPSLSGKWLSTTKIGSLQAKNSEASSSNRFADWKSLATSSQIQVHP